MVPPLYGELHPHRCCHWREPGRRCRWEPQARRPPDHRATTPRGRRNRAHVRLYLLAFALGTLVVAATSAAPATRWQLGPTSKVTVRVEGKTQEHLSGRRRASLVPAQGSLAAAKAMRPWSSSRPNVLGALEAASLAGEFNYNLMLFSFGAFVDRIGRFGSRADLAGWFFKVNGKAPASWRRRCPA